MNMNVLLSTPNQWLSMHIGIIHICFFFNLSLVCTNFLSIIITTVRIIFIINYYLIL